MRILLADDHPLFAEGLKNLLVSHGIDVVGVARDGFEALDEARRLLPDVVLMDIIMPRCNGLAATRLIKAELPDIKIVMLTMSEADGDLFESIKSGASGYLLKNLNAEELVEMLEDLARGDAPFSPGLGAKLLEEFTRLAGEAGASGPGRRAVSRADMGSEPRPETGSRPGPEPRSEQEAEPESEGEPGPGTTPAATEAAAETGSAASEAPVEAEGPRGDAAGEWLTPRQMEVLTLVAKGMTYKEVGAALYISERTVKYHMKQILDQLHLRNRAQVIAYAARTNLTRNAGGGG
ncbi:MAG: response regulator [Bacillota bacterium]